MIRQRVEREIKLTVPPDFRLPDLPGERIPPRTFTSVYYDTQDFRLARAGVTLRRRVERRRNVWQLKLQRGSARLELECRGGPSGAPVELRNLLFAHIHDVPLLPVATLRTRRTGTRVRGIEGPIADVTLDRVAVLRDGRPVGHFAEVEIEQTGRDHRPLALLAEALREAGAGDHDQRPNVFRALGLEPGGERGPAPDAPSTDHLRAALACQVDALLAHDPGTRLGTDPEDLHKMRVATRRLRAYLRAARPMLEREWADALRAELGWLGRGLGPARDLDVMRQHLQDQATTVAHGDRRALGRLLAGIDAQRAAARATMLEGLNGDRYLKLLERLRKAALAPRATDPTASLAHFAAKEFKKLRRAMRDFDPDMGDQALHRLRILGKRARYAAELAEAGAGKPAGRFIKAAKAVQDCLGEHQDAVAAEARLRQLVAGTRGASTALVAGILIEHLHRQRRRARRETPKVWKTLEKRGRQAWSTFLTPDVPVPNSLAASGDPHEVGCDPEPTGEERPST